MAETGTGWPAGIPKRAGWYFMRDEGATQPIVDGLVVWVGHNASGVRHEGQFFYANHKWLQRREFLGPVTASDAEELMELRGKHDSALRDLTQAAFALHVEANHKPSAFATCSNTICANACRVFNAHVATLNPSQAKKER